MVSHKPTGQAEEESKLIPQLPDSHGSEDTSTWLSWCVFIFEQYETSGGTITVAICLLAKYREISFCGHTS